MEALFSHARIWGGEVCQTHPCPVIDMDCIIMRQNASGRQTIFFLSGLLSRHTFFIACNASSHLSLLCVCVYIYVCVCVCMCACVRACVRACVLNLLCFLRCTDVKLYPLFFPNTCAVTMHILTWNFFMCMINYSSLSHSTWVTVFRVTVFNVVVYPLESVKGNHDIIYQDSSGYITNKPTPTLSSHTEASPGRWCG